MPAHDTIRLADLDAARRLAAQAMAARRVDEGGAVVGPMVLGYALLAQGNMLDRLGLASTTAANPTHLPAHLPAWLAPDEHTLLDHIPTIAGVQRRVLRRLDPGLVLWRVGMEPAAITSLVNALGFSPGAVDDRRTIRVRLGDQWVLSRIAALASERACAVWPLHDESGAPCLTADAAARAVARLPRSDTKTIQVLDAGEVSASKHVGARLGATVIDLNAAGGVHVEVEGAYQRRFVLGQAGLNILFVCTGNTCRSPMAEAIATGLLSRREAGMPVHVSSAGVGAGHGAPQTPEGVAALRELGYAPSRHTSRPLTRDLIGQADVIYVMTSGHLSGVLDLDPDARVELLDPSGGDVPDPIGAGPDVYRQTARRLEDLISRRLKELKP